MIVKGLINDGIGMRIAKISVCIILVAALIFVSFLLLFPVLKREKVSINLNDGETVFVGDSMPLSPGCEIERGFFIRNESTCDVYYRIYIKNLTGTLATRLIATVADKDGNEIYSSVMSEFLKENITAPFGELCVDETKELLFKIYCPTEVENIDDVFVGFDISVEAVQTKNNPDGLF